MLLLSHAEVECKGIGPKEYFSSFLVYSPSDSLLATELQLRNEGGNVVLKMAKALFDLLRPLHVLWVKTERLL